MKHAQGCCRSWCASIVGRGGILPWSFARPNAAMSKQHARHSPLASSPACATSRNKTSSCGALAFAACRPLVPLQRHWQPKFQLESDSSSTIVRPGLTALTTSIHPPHSKPPSLGSYRARFEYSTRPCNFSPPSKSNAKAPEHYFWSSSPHQTDPSLKTTRHKTQPSPCL